MRTRLTNLAAKLSRRTEAGRLRFTGTCVLAAGIVAGIVYYAVYAQSDARSMDQLMPGYDRARIRETGIMLGRFGVVQLEYQDALARPGTQAVLIAAGAGLWSLYFFRAAWVLDEEARQR
jgi:hypothetical protein